MTLNGHLLRAVWDGNMIKLSESIANGADVNFINTTNTDKMTPLHWAANYNNADTIRELIAHGANIEAEDGDGYTPLHTAAVRNHPESAKVLLEAHANIEARDDYGMTPLHKAACNGADEVVLLLLDHGVDVSVVDGNGYAAADSADHEGHRQIARLLQTAILQREIEQRMAPQENPNNEKRRRDLASNRM